jgi:hypothetical protein
MKSTAAIEQVSVTALGDVVGGLTGKKAAVTTTGAVVGGVIGFQGVANPVGVASNMIHYGSNLADDWKNGSYGQMLVDTAAAGASLVPGPIGAAGGAWTQGKSFSRFAD